MSERLTDNQAAAERMAPGASLHVEVIADLACPFCYLGKRRLATALRAVRGPYDVSWLPWQLNPDMPTEGQSLDEYLTHRFGSPAIVEPILQSLTAEGKGVGIAFRFDRMKRVPNTLKAHQLMYLAESERRDQSALADNLMSAFFERGEDIGDTAVLVEQAGRQGIKPDDVVRAIDDEAARQIVATREGQVRASGIAGVPGFLLNRRLLIVGAQDADAMVNAFDRAMFGEGTDRLVSPALH